MSKKSLEAFATGAAIWIGGMSLIGLFGNAGLFPSAAVAAAFAAFPLMVILTRFHLRGVPAAEMGSAAIRFGVLVTAIQFPLDVFGWWVIFNLCWPPQAQAAREATMLGLEIGYFAMLAVPYWMGRKGA
jgi:hypothetical protein